jgi:hypothetical protein
MAEIPMSQPGYSASSERPLGVTIIAVLQLLSSIVMLFGGYLLVFVGAGLGFFGLGLLFGGIFLIVGLIGFIIGWGLWTLKSWAWMIAFVLNLINVLIALIGMDIISLIIPLIIVIYLNQGEVKAAFGR